MLNKIVLMGRMTRDVELRYTQSGTPVASFTLAVDRDFKNQSGEKETDFVPVTVWRGTAEFVSKYFSKGSMAIVEGRLQIRNWVDKEGGKRKTAEVVAENVYFGDTKKSSSGKSNSNSGGQYGGYGGGGYNDGENIEYGEEEFTELEGEETEDFPWES